MPRALWALAFAGIVVGCAPSAPPRVPDLTLAQAGGGRVALPEALHEAKFTVVLFYADACPCFRIHDDRIRALAKTYGPHGVRFFIVDSEVSATAERDARAVQERGLPPVLIDPGAKLAEALGAEYATYAVILDERGTVRYRGGIDSDKARLNDDAKPYLRDAIDDLLAGRQVRVAEGKALGCALQTR